MDYKAAAGNSAFNLTKIFFLKQSGNVSTLL
jgi:hypothetical protein